MFKDFGKRLQRDIKRSVDARLRVSEMLQSESLSEGRIKVSQTIFLNLFLMGCIFYFSMLIILMISINLLAKTD